MQPQTNKMKWKSPFRILVFFSSVSYFRIPFFVLQKTSKTAAIGEGFPCLCVCFSSIEEVSALPKCPIHMAPILNPSEGRVGRKGLRLTLKSFAHLSKIPLYFASTQNEPRHSPVIISAHAAASDLDPSQHRCAKNPRNFIRADNNSRHNCWCAPTHAAFIERNIWTWYFMFRAKKK